jgi:prolyl oligopeptidase
LEGDPRFKRNYELALRSRLAEGTLTGTLGGAATPAALTQHGDRVYQFWTDEDNPQGVWRSTSLDSFLSHAPKWEILLDLDQLRAKEGRPFIFGRALFSPSGRRCLIALGIGTVTISEFREFDLERRAFRSGGFVVPQTWQGTAVWKDDDTLLTAADFGSGTLDKRGMPLTVREWSRGQTLTEAKELFRAPPDGSFVSVSADRDENGRRAYIIASLDQAAAPTYLKMNEQGGLDRMSVSPSASAGVWYTGQYIFQTADDWTLGEKTWPAGSLLSIENADLAKAKPSIRLVMNPGAQTTIESFRATKSGLLALASSGGTTSLLSFKDTAGEWTTTEVPLPRFGTIDFALTEPTSSVALLTYESFLHAPSLYRVDVATDEVTLAKKGTDQFNSEPFVTEQAEAKSRDGTLVPYFLVRPRKSANGTLPTVVHAYGAFGWSQSPKYLGAVGKLWLEQGGAYVVANVRGGAERGAVWHVTRADRRHTYEDLVAVLEDLFRRGLTEPKRVGVAGLSAGGLLAGVVMTGRPDLVGAAVLRVPVLDQLRTDLNGIQAGFIETEYGSPAVPEELKFLQETSPFQNLSKDRPPPPPLIVTCTTDTAVPPAQARRFAAKMESLKMPFFFYETSQGGHAAFSTPAEAAWLDALVFTYLSRRLIDGDERPEA